MIERLGTYFPPRSYLLATFIVCQGMLQPVRAATIVGRDCGGADLICDGTATCGGAVTCKNGDELQGAFTHVGLFSVGQGTTVFVAANVPLVVYASTVNVQGTINGIGSGKLGGTGGKPTQSGSNGFGAAADGSGGGGGGAYAAGSVSTAAAGGGGSYGGTGGQGADAAGGAGGAVYDSTGLVSSPISSDDIFMGSGGGGGAGSVFSKYIFGGSGGVGGGSIYLEASSVTVTGSGMILMDGGAGSSVADVGSTTGHPAAGGGGSGGGVLIRASGFLELDGSTISASGGKGGDETNATGGNVTPGGGGGGGRIKIFYRTALPFTISLSTAGGAAGGRGSSGLGPIDPASPVAGSSGTVSFGVIASSPAGVSAGAVYVASISWSWTAAPAATAYWGDADPVSRQFRVFPSTAIPPYVSPQSTAPAGANSAVETGLSPNTTYYRFLTSFTDWGDSLASNVVSTHTLASTPGAGTSVFSVVTKSSITFNWTAGSPANPGYTTYQVQRTTDSAFASPSASFATALSSACAGLSPNTTYYFRANAVNLDGIPSPPGPVFSTATLAVMPGSPAPASVFVTSVVFSWASLNNPSYTPYTAEISSDNFFTLNASTITLGTQAVFMGLSPGLQYFLRVKATNLDAVDTAYTAVVSTAPGVAISSGTLQPVAAPGTPSADRSFSYDGTAVFGWTPAQTQSPAAILDYTLAIGTLPGANDFFSGNIGNVLSYTATGLASGKTYYARVQARSNQGVLSVWSNSSAGVVVFVTAQQPAIDHPFNWPNPFDPSRGPTNIGFSLAAPASVTLKIYTLQGNPVYHGTQGFAAGNQVWVWSGSNDAGARASPGGYIGVLEIGYADHTETKKFKMALLY